MKKLLLITLFLTVLVSCKVQYVATYSPTITADAISARVYSDSLFTAMVNSPDKSYATYQPGYFIENLKLQNLVFAEKMRPHAQFLAAQAQRILDQFTIFQNDHAINTTLSSTILRGYQALIDDLFRSYITSQNSLENAKLK